MSLDTLYILLRLLHFSMVILMFGISIFVVCLSTQTLRPVLSTQLNTTLIASILTLMLTSVDMISVQAGLMGDGWSDMLNLSILSAVLDTAFGQAWRWQIIFSAAAILCLRLKPQYRFNLSLLFSTLLLINLGFVGHVTLHSGLLGWLHRINHAIHLLSGGYWLGTLIPLLVCLRYLASTELHADAVKSMVRFSHLGHVAVLLVVVSGIINSGLILQRWPLDWSSYYQLLLCVKIAIVAIMIAIALFNRYQLVPRMKSSTPRILSWFTLLTTIEIALGFVVLSLVSLFATLSPV
ncbi:copper homeostasis membrane protein CopD [Pragia fontium]|uniref:Copper resistance protein D n=3 Tax=Pragia fontium TaxID=82985 RepID=A0AAJ4W8W0_9GAMM|nr:copper homeostasis membrane protein CopD [Pragia fontium]GKX62141.1 copper resistance protein D [Pragia fontium]SFC36875.1 putative copper resistance protein D [Pragia fontium DSM 5563 = ATCC 49100]VEJ54684.1 Inner membrane protein YebZ [Pragia fontium]